MDLQLVLGETIQSGEEFLDLSEHQVLPLDSKEDHPVSLYLDGQLFARGTLLERENKHVVQIERTFGHVTLNQHPTLHRVASTPFAPNQDERENDNLHLCLLAPNPAIKGFLTIQNESELNEYPELQNAPSTSGEPIKDEDTLLQWLDDLDIHLYDNIENRIPPFFNSEDGGYNQDPIEIAGGIDPVPGEPAQIIWKEELEDLMDTNPIEENTADHDENQKQSENNKTSGSTTSPGQNKMKKYYPHLKIPNIESGDLICQYLSPIKGKPGKDIFGNKIPSLKKSEQKKQLSAGENVRIEGEADLKQFISEADGHVEFNRGEWELNVIEEYEIHEEIAKTDEVISYNGRLIIHEEIPDGVKIHTLNGIELHDSVRAIHLESEGPIIVHSGISARGEGHIKSEDRVKAQYINEGNVEAEELQVEGEILNSTLYAEELNNEDGKIQGGETMILKNAKLGEVGSYMGVQTKITIGIKPGTNERIDEIQEKRSEIEDELNQLQAQIGTEKLEKDPQDVISEASEDKKEFYEEAFEQYKELQEEQEELKSELNQLQEQLNEEPWETIQISDVIHPGVEVQMGNVTKRFHDKKEGPVKLTVDSDQRAIRAQEVD